MKNHFLFFILIVVGLLFFQVVEAADKIFQAQVLEVIKQETNTLSDGTKVLQQKIKLKGLDSEYKGKEVIFDGINDYDVLNKNIYQVGDKVLVVANSNDKEEITFYITGYVRTKSLKWLFAIFAVALIIVGRLKGARALLSLVLTFVVVVKYIIPNILQGGNPISITLIGSALILFTVIYLTEGFKRSAHLAVLSTLISLIITIAISWLFVNMAKLSGFDGEEMAYLVNIGVGVVNFKGLLLAGVIIGALGVLDDVVVSQIVAVEEIIKIDAGLNRKAIFKKAYKIGISHISSMTNTLFLAYAGVSLPLLILFASGQSAFSDLSQILNNEAVATEIIRTLAGSIGLILAVPISTGIAVLGLAKK